MKIFVFEYVTGGGCAGLPLPDYVGDGELMWRALVRDLTALPGIEVITLRDARLAVPSRPGFEVVGTDAARFHDDFAHCLAEADAVLPVAPESDGLLEGIGRRVLAAGKRLLGCHPDAVRVAASKLATWRQLTGTGLRLPRVYLAPGLMTDDRPVVAKPDDGAGCQDTLWFPDPDAATAWAARQPAGSFIYQYQVPGAALSLAMLCCRGRAQLLAVNRQHVAVLAGRFQATGVTVNALPDPEGAYQRIAAAVAESLPDLWGYVGVDLVAAADGPRIIEINPRITLSYAGLAEATASNPAARILALPAFSPCRGRRAVDLLGHPSSPERVAA
ncbi:ATP-grasp domain-containing protein [Parasulfuritortus cantonensis]|uniref:ATP-grasp domain-containing protein n=1 Tax=Parasulfuritortus cantonensis TaxID=2528202 RepID=A0A4R1B6I8_9PROT|nr:ATP-grasp domain-containing protein [Parasulfuritortus cantonensis]TCJ11888.1 ATP-grasp domain-containing protein [Parasulfuritortus cantonensis]